MKHLEIERTITMTTLLTAIASMIEKIAILGAGLASYGGMYQPPKPKCLYHIE